jgi:hypothetical protein
MNLKVISPDSENQSSLIFYNVTKNQILHLHLF